MTSRHLTTAVTLVVLSVILVIGAVVGFNALFAPLPGEEEPAASPSTSCAVEKVRKGKRLRAGQVTVNVFNASARAGLAGQTMDALRARNFRGGQIGNAPDDAEVVRVQVWIEAGERDAGRLVAQQFGRKVRVFTPDQDLADGVDVVVGPRYRGLVGAPRFVVVKNPPKSECG